MMNTIENSRLLIVGLARDCESSLSASIDALKNAFEQSRELSFLILESDSSDKTPSVLQELQERISGLDYKCLGELSADFPLRTQRIAHCRNTCLQEISNKNQWGCYDYIAVADLDGVNHMINKQSVNSCWERTDWDVCTANQAGPYYDIWALRHKIWSPNDCWEAARFLVGNGVNSYKAMQAAVYSKMITISPESPWIEVDSAFGGLAIYKAAVLSQVHYIGLNEQNEEICEHVSVHAQIKSTGGRIFINPALINAGIVDHTRAMSGLTNLKSRLRSNLRDYLDGAGLLNYAKKLKKILVNRK